MAQAQLLYAATGADSEAAKTGARWLVLAEVPAAALQQALASPLAGFDALGGDAGKLLDNMLRAARLPSARSVHLVAIARDMRAPADAGLPASSTSNLISLSRDLAAALPALVAAVQPDLLLVMGRFAGQALLQSDLPFGKLRGQSHSLLGKPVIVTYDAAYLLRQQLEKARAWDDLRLAMSVAAGAGG
jgi:DNA polymerase